MLDSLLDRTPFPDPSEKWRPPFDDPLPGDPAPFDFERTSKLCPPRREPGGSPRELADEAEGPLDNGSPPDKSTTIGGSSCARGSLDSAPIAPLTSPGERIAGSARSTPRLHLYPRNYFTGIVPSRVLGSYIRRDGWRIVRGSDAFQLQILSFSPRSKSVVACFLVIDKPRQESGGHPRPFVDR